MNPRFAVIVVALALAGSQCQGQGEAQAIMVQQRAKKIAAANDQRQQALGGDSGQPAAPTTAQPAQPAAPVAPVLTPEQQALVGLNTDLAAIKTGTDKAQVDSLAANLRANSHGAVKPSTTKLAADLAAVLPGKILSAAQRGRIAQDIQVVLSNTIMPLAQYNDVASDVAGVLKKAGADPKLVAAVDEDLKAIAAQVRKKN